MAILNCFFLFIYFFVVVVDESIFVFVNDTPLKKLELDLLGSSSQAATSTPTLIASPLALTIAYPVDPIAVGIP